MQRASLKRVAARVRNLKAGGADISLVSMGSGRQQVHNKKQNAALSPVLATGQLANWLDGFENGRKQQPVLVIGGGE